MSGFAFVIDPPDTELAAMAQALAQTCDPHVLDHCERSYQFAAMFARLDGVVVDDEVLYIGTILHDVGLALRHRGPDQRFEVRGANEVRTILLGDGMARDRAENVWDVIALHASTAIAAHKSPETAYANRGISLDVRGGPSALPEADVRAVLDRFPRTDFAAAFASTLIDEVRANPATVRLSWMESIAAAHVPEYQRSDFLATLHASSGFV